MTIYPLSSPGMEFSCQLTVWLVSYSSISSSYELIVENILVEFPYNYDKNYSATNPPTTSHYDFDSLLVSPT